MSIIVCGAGVGDRVLGSMSMGPCLQINVCLGEMGSTSVLVSARIELIFFLVAGIVLCFGFSRKTMLIIH